MATQAELIRHGAADNIARRLYPQMPGAPKPTCEQGVLVWGEIECTEHWQFCQQIAKEIINASGRTYLERD